MKKSFFYLVSLIFVLSSCKPVVSVPSTPHTDTDGNLIGIVRETDFLKPPFVEWFDKEYNSYVPDIKVVTHLKPLMKDIEIKAVMGTWCSDSRREVPRFYKILDMTRFDYNKIKMAAVNRDKQLPQTMGKKLSIKRVPTFIFYRNGKEINRIVEYPIESLEKDMLSILSGKPYKHAYAE